MANELIGSIENGKLVNGSSVVNDAVKKADNTLGKDAFLQLLVAQMKYQDPLNPNTDTEFVAQLAQFSSLEQMQNLSQTSLNSQAFSLVGKEVVVRVQNEATGEVDYVQGPVDYVTVKSGEAKLSINDKMYPMDDLYTVIDDAYAVSKLIPSVEELKASYEHANPTDLQVKISLGVDDYEASSIAVFVGGTVIDSKYLAYDEKSKTLTIAKEAFESFDAGTYNVGFMFDDILTTTVTDKVSLTVTGIKPVTEETGSESENAEGETIVPEEEQTE